MVVHALEFGSLGTCYLVFGNRDRINALVHRLSTIPVFVACSCKDNDLSSTAPCYLYRRRLDKCRVVNVQALQKNRCLLAFLAVFLDIGTDICGKPNGDCRIDDFASKGARRWGCRWMLRVKILLVWGC